MKLLYTDGGCSKNWQKDQALRKMIAVVSDDQGNILVERTVQGGSNNIAELIAIQQALDWAHKEGYTEIEVRTDSQTAISWSKGRIGNKLKDLEKVVILKNSIERLRCNVHLTLTWIPREDNVAGNYIENKCGL